MDAEYDGRFRATAVVEQVAATDVAAPAVFVGREQQVSELLDHLNPTGSRTATTAVSAVAGMAGVGKTELARHVARVAVGRGWFSGGAVLVDLHGYDREPDTPVASSQVFAPVLRALGVPAERIPPGVDEQAAVYHQVLASLAERRQRVLLVLDNASAVEQVTALLPRQPMHRVLVTSRHTLGDLGGLDVLDLGVLDTAEAVDMIDRTLRERDPADRRAVDQPDQTTELTRACGCLPLALRVAAALLADDPGLTVADLLGRLTDPATRLDALAHGTQTVTGAFDSSWWHLHREDPHAARLFRLLPVNPGPDIALDAAAALVDQIPARVRPLLRALRQAHLIEPGTAPGRWRMHDLAHAYAIGLPADPNSPGERDTAIGRLLDHYLTTTGAADDRLRALPGQPVPDRFASREDALAWLDTERANLVAAVDLAAATGRYDTAVRLALALAEYLSLRRHLDDWVASATTARDAARHLGDRHSEGTTWNNLGLALRHVRQFDQAIAAHQRAGDIFRQTGDRHGQGTAWKDVGSALAGVRRFDEAITAFQRSGDIFRQTGDRHGEGMALGNLGVILREVGRFDEAVTAHETARDIFRQIGDRHREGMAWDNLGASWAAVRRFDEAVVAHQRAGDIFRDTGDRHGQGTAFGNLGNVLRKRRRFDEAIIAHETAVDIYRETGDLHGEGAVLLNLGLSCADAGRFDEAISTYRHAGGIFRFTGDLYGEGLALSNLGVALVTVRRFDEAITALEQAVANYTKSNSTDAAENIRRFIKMAKDIQSEA